MKTKVNELSKSEMEQQIKRIFIMSSPTKDDLERSRILTRRYVEETNYKTND